MLLTLNPNTKQSRKEKTTTTPPENLWLLWRLTTILWFLFSNLWSRHFPPQPFILLLFSLLKALLAEIALELRGVAWWFPLSGKTLAADCGGQQLPACWWVTALSSWRAWKAALCSPAMERPHILSFNNSALPSFTDDDGRLTIQQWHFFCLLQNWVAWKPSTSIFLIIAVSKTSHFQPQWSWDVE